MNIYTKNGDFGYTTDINGHKTSKADSKLMLQGSIDEVNSAIGYLRALINDVIQQGTDDPQEVTKKASLTDKEAYLKEIQYKLFQMGTDISSDFSQCHFNEQDITDLEKAIDSSLETTGKLNHFLCLGGSLAGAWCHTLRSITRRAEREFVQHLETTSIETIPLAYKYLNRLADYFFQLARHLNYLTGQEEESF